MQTCSREVGRVSLVVLGKDIVILGAWMGFGVSGLFDVGSEV